MNSELPEGGFPAGQVRILFGKLKDSKHRKLDFIDHLLTARKVTEFEVWVIPTSALDHISWEYALTTRSWAYRLGNMDAFRTAYAENPSQNWVLILDSPHTGYNLQDVIALQKDSMLMILTGNPGPTADQIEHMDKLRNQYDPLMSKPESTSMGIAISWYPKRNSDIKD